MTRRAAVTGATGFLGRQLVRALQAEGWRVRALARRQVTWLGEPPEIVGGDLADQAALERLCGGAEVVVHAAALVKARGAAEFEAANVEGARRLAAAAAGCDRSVLVSTLAAREPHLSAYAASKRAGESAMTERLGERLTVVRPPAIYGPADRELLPVFRAAAASPVLPVFNPAARVAMVHVEDAARQIAALASGAESGRTVALSDARPEGYGWVELMAAAAEACGRRVRLVRAPDALLRLAGITIGFAARLGATPMLTAGKARELLHPDWSVAPHERAAKLPAPLYDLRKGFAQTVAWYRGAAWMKH